MSRVTERDRGRLAARVAEHLHEGEVVQAAIFAQDRGRGPREWFGNAPALTMRSYWIVATNERIVVFNGLVKAIKGIAGELPRDTHLGPPRGKGSLFHMQYRLDLLGKAMLVPRAWWGEVRAADAALATAAGARSAPL